MFPKSIELEFEMLSDIKPCCLLRYALMPIKSTAATMTIPPIAIPITEAAPSLLLFRATRKK